MAVQFTSTIAQVEPEKVATFLIPSTGAPPYPYPAPKSGASLPVSPIPYMSQPGMPSQMLIYRAQPEPVHLNGYLRGTK